MKVILEEMAQPYLIRIIEESKDEIASKLDQVWRTKKDGLMLDGFRKGHVPQSVAEKMMGFTGLYKEYIDELLTGAIDRLSSEQSATVIDLQQVIPEKLSKDGIIMQAVAYLKPKVLELDYSNVVVSKSDSTISEEEVLQRLEGLRQQHQISTPITDRGVQFGDTITITFVGSLNGVPFEGGKAQRQQVTLNQGTFIPGFGEAIVDMQPGTQKTFPVTFPKDYHAAHLAGKETSFDLMVHDICVRTLPALDDEFAKTLNYSSKEELLSSAKKELEDELNAYNRSRTETEICNELLVRAKIAPIPTSMVQKRVEQLLQQELATYNLSETEYLKKRNIDKATFERAYYQQALKDLKIQLILDYVATQEKLESSEEERVEYLKGEADRLGYTLDQVTKMVATNQVDTQVKLRKAYDILLDKVMYV